MVDNLSYLTIAKAVSLLKSKKLSSVELTGAYLEKIKLSQPILNSYITILEQEALVKAQIADEKYSKGTNGILEGIPLALKDNLITQNIRTTCASKMLNNFVPPYDGDTSAKLKQHGAVLLGKLNMDEFGMGSSNEHSFFGPAKNPFDTSRSPGGSSGGAASAVASSSCMAALATDTGGSIRQPASFCGVVGLRPTYGRVSRYGLVAFASSLDQTGPICKSVEDCAILLDAISGYDKKDATSVNIAKADISEISQNSAPLKIGIPDQYLSDDLDQEVGESVESAIRHLEKAGHSIQRISLPHSKYAIAAYYIIVSAEASSNLARYDGIRYGLNEETAENFDQLFKQNRNQGFGEEVKRRIMLGSYCLSAGYYDRYYSKAMKTRQLITEDFNTAFNSVDIIVTPTSPTTAFKLQEKQKDVLSMYLADVYTIPPNLAGLPSISLPCGYDKKGLPIGLQMVGRAFDESTLLSLAQDYEKKTKWHKKKPEVPDAV